MHPQKLPKAADYLTISFSIGIIPVKWPRMDMKIKACSENFFDL
jgi:hypothetical protein